MANNPLESAFWNEEEEELWLFLINLTVETLQAGTMTGLQLLPVEYRALADFDVVNKNVLNYLHDYRFNWIKKINDTTRDQVRTAMETWINSGEPLDSLEAMLTPLFGEARAGMIAVTETTRVYAEGNREAWESTDVVDEMVWFTAEDDLVCPICSDLNGTHMGIGDIDATPPAHVNCRCMLRPVVSEERVAAKLDRILGL